MREHTSRILTFWGAYHSIKDRQHHFLDFTGQRTSLLPLEWHIGEKKPRLSHRKKLKTWRNATVRGITTQKSRTQHISSPEGWITMCYCQSEETSGLRHWGDWTHCAGSEGLKYQKNYWNICRYVGTQVLFPSHWGCRVSVCGGNYQWIYQHFRVSCLPLLIILVLNVSKHGSWTFRSDRLHWC